MPVSILGKHKSSHGSERKEFPEWRDLFYLSEMADDENRFLSNSILGKTESREQGLDGEPSML